MAICAYCGEDPCGQHYRCSLDSLEHTASVHQLRSAGWERCEAENEADHLMAERTQRREPDMATVESMTAAFLADCKDLVERGEDFTKVEDALDETRTQIEKWINDRLSKLAP